jgi:hypothetical protein
MPIRPAPTSRTRGAANRDGSHVVWSDDYEVTRVERSWAGLRTFAPDRVPVIGFDPAADGFFRLAGQGGYGVRRAPASGRHGYRRRHVLLRREGWSVNHKRASRPKAACLNAS